MWSIHNLRNLGDYLSVAAISGFAIEYYRLDTYVEFLILSHQVPYVAEQSHAYGTSPSETVNP